MIFGNLKQIYLEDFFQLGLGRSFDSISLRLDRMVETAEYWSHKFLGQIEQKKGEGGEQGVTQIPEFLIFLKLNKSVHFYEQMGLLKFLSQSVSLREERRVSEVENLHKEDSYRILNEFFHWISMELDRVV